MKKQHVSKVLSIILIFTFIMLNFIPAIKALEISVALPQSAITVTNNKLGIDDIIEVTGLVEGDIVNLYSATTGGTLRGSATTGVGQTSAIITIPQVGSTAGYVYVSVTNVNKLESLRTTKVYASEPTTTSLLASAITVTNNKIGIDDKVEVTGLGDGDLIKVYSATTGGTVLGSGTVAIGQTSVTITVPQVGVAAGSVYISITKDGKLESARTLKGYTSETTVTPVATNITVVNNYVGTDDTVTVAALIEGDIVNLYSATTGGTLLGSATTGVGQASVTITLPELGTTAGSVYVSVTNINKLESLRVAKAYAAEPATTALLESAITVTNNKVGLEDKVEVTGLGDGDIIKVYTASTGGIVLGSATVAVGQTSVTIAVPQVGAIAGRVYVSITKVGRLESARTLKAYTSETTITPVATNITVVNNYVGTDDTVTVAALVEGDIVKLYSTTTGGTLMGSATTVVGQTSVTITLPQVGITAGSVYVSVTNVNKLESLRVTKVYASEPTTAALLASAIAVTNNKVGIDDKVEVTGLVDGDLINVYTASTGGTVLGSATVAVGQTSISITVPQVGAIAGSVYVSVTKAGKLESTRTLKAYASETTMTPVATNITVVNNYVGTDDTVTVAALLEGDIVNLYSATTGGTLLGSAATGVGQTSVTITLPQVGITAGNIYVSVTNVNKLESLRVAKAYIAEPTTTTLLASAIAVTNNKVGIDDKVEVTGLVDGDIINVYNASLGGTVLGSATVAVGQTSVTIIVPQVGTIAGIVYISVKKEGNLESERTPKAYTSETTIASVATNITVVNNYEGTDDTVTVVALVEGDIVNLYSATTGGTLLGSATTGVGQTSVTITLPQVGITAGNIYVSVTNVNKLESLRTTKAYIAEPTATALLASAITVTNNKVGIDDKIEITGLVDGDIITVYTLAAGGTVLASATVAVGQNSLTITVPQVGAIAGSVYVSVTKAGKLESARTLQTYTSETTIAPVATNITVVNNNEGTDDTVKVAALVEGDIVSVYSAATGGTLQGSATTGVGQTSVTITLPQIGTTAGSVYVSVTNVNKLESLRVTKVYIAEPATIPLLASAIAVTNNKLGIDDKVEVTGLVEGDIITIYTLATGGTVLASATVAVGQTSVTITVPQVGAIAGSVYVSVKSAAKFESARTPQTYTSETTIAPAATNITVVNNNVGTEDTVTVTALVEGDIVKLYSATTGGALLGSETTGVGQTSATISILQLGSSAGYVYVSVTKVNKLESLRTTKTYVGEPTIEALPASAITVTNNKVGIDDKVEVTGLLEGDIVNVYTATTGGTLLGNATVAVGQTSVNITIPQIGAISGSIHVSVKRTGKLESPRTPKAYTSETTIAPVVTNITVVNNYIGTEDTVTVAALVDGDTVNIYNESTGGILLGSATTGVGQTSLTIALPQIGSTAGSIYVSITNLNKLESLRVTKAYIAEPITTALLASVITVTNNKVGIDDKVVVTGLVEGDIIKVYTLATGGTLLGSGTVAVGQTSVIITVSQVGSTAGSIYVSLTNLNKLESLRVTKAYVSEPTTAALLASAITVTNNKVGVDDIVVVTGLAEGDIIKVYTLATGGTLLGSGTVAVGETSVIITVSQVGSTAGNVYISVKKDGSLESARTVKAYTTEITPTPVATNITVVNNYIGIDDKVTVAGLVNGEIVNIYNLTTGGTLLGSATIGVGQTSASITVAQLGSIAGSVYVSVTKVNKLESLRVAKAYIAEPSTIVLPAAAITVTNNKVGIDDKVVVTGLAEGYIINVYTLATGGTLLGSGAVAVGQTSVTVTLPQVGALSGNVYISVKKDGSLESARTAKAYTSETTPTPVATNVTVMNNYVGTDDTVTVTKLVDGDIVNVYNAATGGTLLGSATIGVGQTSETITVAQLGSLAGSVYVSVTNVNKLESLRVRKTYLAEPTTTALLAAAITVTNNKVGIDDIIGVTGLVEGDIITVYTLATGGVLLGSATVGVGQTSVTITVPQVGAIAGRVYLSIKKEGKLESARTTKTFIAE